MTIFGFDISGIITVLKVLGFIISLGFGVGIVLSFLGNKKVMEQRAQKQSEHFHIHPTLENPRTDRWDDISKHFQSNNPVEWRMAIIDADSILEEIITSIGYTGENFGEKLKSIPREQVSWLDSAWQVHKLRNTLAHQGTQYHLTEREAYQTFKTYEQIFYETGYLS